MSPLCTYCPFKKKKISPSQFNDWAALEALTPPPSARAPPPLSFLCLCIKASISFLYLLQRSLLPCSVKLKRHVKCHWTPPNGNRKLPALVSHIMTQLLAGIKHAPPWLSPHAPCQLTCLESRNILALSMHANPQPC